MKNFNERSVTLRIPETQENVSLAAYVVDNNGKLVESVLFDKNIASLTQTRSDISGRQRIYIAQAFPKEFEKKVNERVLLNAGAYAVVQNFKGNEIPITRLPGTIYGPPCLFEFCAIHGNISNLVTIDGAEVSFPVCNARVHVEQVERRLRYPIWPVWYDRVPDPVINDIRDTLLKVPPVSQAAVAPLPDHVLQGIQSASRDTLLKTLADNEELIRPYLCLWPRFWPWLYYVDTSDICVLTDCNGNFEAWEIFVSCSQVLPLNVYIWVEVLIKGVWVTVYRPALPCATHWNYSCDESINVSLRNPAIPLCSCDNTTEQGNVWVKRVGNGTSLLQIAMEPTDPTQPALFSDVRGLANSTGVRGANFVSPFTGDLPVYIQFGNPGSAIYYRWKYRPLTDANYNNLPVAAGYSNMTGSLKKEYVYTGSDGNVHYGEFPLDQIITAGQFYLIPSIDASVTTGVAGAAWYSQDTESIDVNVHTSTLTNALYEFVLELFDSSGTLVEQDTTVFRVDESTAEMASVPAGSVDGNYIVPGVIKPADGFRFLLSINNDRTNCYINEVIVQNPDDTTAITDACGFVQYEQSNPPLPTASTVLLSFLANQPNQFADYSYTITLGNTAQVYATTGQVPPQSANTYINGNLVNEERIVDLSILLDGCTKAAFAEVVGVTAYHTNGSTRLEGFDSTCVAAFAVEPLTTT